MRSLSRRLFLEDSMFAAAALVAGSSARELLAEDQQSKSPNERLNVAVIGVGGRGGSHLGAFSGRKDTLVTHVCDADEKIGQGRVKGVADRQGHAPKFVRDMREIFDDKSVDIVTTATPNHWHALCSIWAVQAGKDVYVEKPVSHNVSEGRRIVEAARKYGRIVQTGTQSRSNPGSREAIAFIHGGKIGEVKLARGLCYKGRGSIGARGMYQPPESVDYSLWCGPAPLSPLTRPKFHYDWHWQWDCGNGDLGNQGIHQMDIARWGLGVDTIGDSVVSFGGRFGYVDAGETANTQVCLHSFGDKRLIFEVRGLSTSDLQGARVGNIFYGSEGYLVLTSYVSGAAFNLKGEKIAEFKGGNDDLHFANFLQAVRSRKHTDLTADILEGHLSSALCHLGNISYRLGQLADLADVRQAFAKDDAASETLERFVSHLAANKIDPATKIGLGKTLNVDPQQEIFPGDDAANALLSREYRAPFVVPAAGKV